MIDSFEGKYAFLSNFYPSPIPVQFDEDIIIDAPTAEHLFQYMKTCSDEEGLAILRADTPGQAKRLGRKCHLRHDWEEIKDEVMYRILKYKFEIPELREKLLATGDEELVEGNTWHDAYWGACKCVACSSTRPNLNKLGKLLMKVRDEICSDMSKEI